MAAAQEPLAVDNNTLWNHYTNQPSCCTTFASTAKDDPRFSGGGNYGTGASTADGSFSWSWPLDPALDRIVHLDPAGKIDATVHIGGSYSTSPYVGSGRVTVTMSLMLGDEVVAQGSGQTINFVTAQAYQKVTWSVAPELTTLDPAAGNLVWTVRAAGAYSGMFLSHTDANGNGWLTLPITGTVAPVVAPDVVHGNLTEPSLHLEFANATTVSHAYNMTSSLGAGRVVVAAQGTGNVTVHLVDAANATLLSATYAGNASQTIDFDAATAGNWTLLLDFADYQGNFTLVVEAPPSEDPENEGTGTDGPGGADPTDGPDGNGTAPASGKDAPWPLPLVPVAVGLVAWLRRRGA